MNLNIVGQIYRELVCIVSVVLQLIVLPSLFLEGKFTLLKWAMPHDAIRPQARTPRGTGTICRTHTGALH